MTPHIKICGVSRVEDAVFALEGGAEFLGLNFVPGSKRRLSADAAAELVRAVDARVPRAPAAAQASGCGHRWIGVFVDPDPAEVEEITARVGLDLLQFHGDESPAEVARFAPRAIKAFRVRRSAAEIELDPWLDLGLWGFLIDTHVDASSAAAHGSHAAAYGGTGARWDTATFAGSPLARERTFLAGGLAPGNGSLAAACAVRPWGVDLCSGVEVTSSAQLPPPKDPDRMNAFFQEIQHGET